MIEIPFMMNEHPTRGQPCSACSRGPEYRDLVKRVYFSGSISLHLCQQCRIRLARLLTQDCAGPEGVDRLVVRADCPHPPSAVKTIKPFDVLDVTATWCTACGQVIE